MALTKGQQPGLFADGALTLHNNPALALALLALIPANGLQWRAGSENLLVVSVGTGSFRTIVDAGAAGRKSAVVLAMRSRASMIAQSEDLVLTMMGFLGQSAVPWVINSEIGDLGLELRGAEPMFRFVRYDARLEADGLRAELGREFNERDVLALRRMDNVCSIERLLDVGREAGAKLVRPEHWSRFRRSPP